MYLCKSAFIGNVHYYTVYLIIPTVCTIYATDRIILNTDVLLSHKAQRPVPYGIILFVLLLRICYQHLLVIK